MSLLIIFFTAKKYLKVTTDNITIIPITDFAQDFVYELTERFEIKNPDLKIS